MKLRTTIRLIVLAMIACGSAALSAHAAEPQPAAGKANHPQVRPGARPPTRPSQEHLQQWLDRHQNLSVQEQLKQLEVEPGFRELPPPTQQQVRDRLIQLNGMAPQQRERLIERSELLERMSVPDRQHYRAAAQSLVTAPPDRRRLMARAVLDLRAMPPDQRQAVINSDRFRGQFSDPERSTISTLLSAEPYQGPQAQQ